VGLRAVGEEEDMARDVHAFDHIDCSTLQNERIKDVSKGAISTAARVDAAVCNWKPLTDLTELSPKELSITL
jgi:hypothetical protein